MEGAPLLRSPSKLRSQRDEPFIIGVAGGTASGKSTVVNAILQRLHEQSVTLLEQDAFYRDLSAEELRNVGDYNFDHPDAFDTPALVDCLSALRQLKPVDVPEYDYVQHRRGDTTRRVMPADVVIIEGILVLHSERLRALCNMKIYVDTDDDVRLARRIQRDVACRGRDVAGVIEQYTRFVKPSFDQFVAPSRRHADVIIPWQRGDNMVAIDLITEHIRMKLQQPDLRRIYSNLEVIPSNFQIRGMHTIIRDRDTASVDYIFYADRLLRLVVEAGLGHLPFKERTVTTPTGHQYVGVEFAKKLCGVSIIRSGESMENALRACCKGIKIGKILVHREKVWPVCAHEGAGAADGATSGAASVAVPRPAHTRSMRVVEREIVYEKLPADIAERYVLLMDPILSSGNSAEKAIEVLLGHGVDEGKLLFLTVIAAPEGIHRLCRRFPRMKLLTSEIDAGMEDFRVVPGCGEFGDRYFCE